MASWFRITKKMMHILSICIQLTHATTSIIATESEATVDCDGELNTLHEFDHRIQLDAHPVYIWHMQIRRSSPSNPIFIVHIHIRTQNTTHYISYPTTEFTHATMSTCWNLQMRAIIYNTTNQHVHKSTLEMSNCCVLFCQIWVCYIQNLTITKFHN